jgi:hypothetical protein
MPEDEVAGGQVAETSRLVSDTIISASRQKSFRSATSGAALGLWSDCID